MHFENKLNNHPAERHRVRYRVRHQVRHQARHQARLQADSKQLDKAVGPVGQRTKRRVPQVVGMAESFRIPKVPV